MLKTTMWFLTRSDTKRPVQSQKQARSLKFWSKVEEELYYPSSENKGTDQLRGYCEADQRLCFRLCRLLVSPWGGSFLWIPSFNHKFKSFELVFNKTSILTYVSSKDIFYLFLVKSTSDN